MCVAVCGSFLCSVNLCSWYCLESIDALLGIFSELMKLVDFNPFWLVYEVGPLYIYSFVFVSEFCSPQLLGHDN